MWSLTKKNDQGWVPIKTICSFKRMRDLVKDLNESEIPDVLSKSESLLEVNDDKTSVRRKVQLQPSTDRESRSIYAKNFPDEYPNLQVDLEQYFKNFGDVISVRMRRDDEKKFKNSVFVEFASQDQANKFLNLVSSEKKYNDVELLTMSKSAYVEMKCKEKGITPGTKSKTPSKHFNAFKEEHKKQKNEKNSLSMTLLGKVIPLNPDGTFDQSLLDFEKGWVLSFKGAGNGNSVINQVKNAAREVLDCSFVILNDDQVSGSIGFKSKVSDDALNQLNDKKFNINGSTITFDRVDDEGERKYYVENAQNLAQATIQKNNKNNKYNNKGNNKKRKEAPTENNS